VSLRQQSDSPPQKTVGSESVRGLTLRAILIVAVLTFFAAKWVQMSELVLVRCLVSESVPPIPAIAALTLLAALIPLSRMISAKRALTRAEVITIFAMMAVAVTVTGYGGLSIFFGNLLVPFYYADPSNHFADLQRYVPSWFQPRDQQVIYEFFEGSYTGVTPWVAWLPHLVIWGAFFLVLFFTMACLVRVFYNHWTRQERLTFPIVQMVMALGTATSPQEGQVPFFRNPLTWVGLTVAFLFNLMNMINAFNPDFPATGVYYDLSGIFRERPWSAIGYLVFRWDPAMMGMGYLMSAEVLLSVIVGHFFFKAQSVVASAIGYKAPFPSREAASAGGYLVLVSALAWGARRHLWQSLRRSLFLPTERPEVPPAPRWAVWGILVGIAALAVFFLACKLSLRRAGTDFSLWVMGGFMFLFLAFAVGYARIRAETGAPMSWLFPGGAHGYAIQNTFGTKTLLAAGGPANLVMLAEFYSLSLGYFQSEMAVQVENFRLGDLTRVSTASMATAGMVGLAIGLICGMYFQLTAYYNYGASLLHVPLSTLAVYPDVIERVRHPGTADVQRQAWLTAGFINMAAVLCLTYARRALFRFPLHPLGLVMGICHGDPLWGPFLLSWFCKVASLRIGGMGLYRRLVPLFLGLVVGHYFVGGVVWGLLGLLSGNPAFSRYCVYFG